MEDSGHSPRSPEKCVQRLRLSAVDPKGGHDALVPLFCRELLGHLCHALGGDGESKAWRGLFRIAGD
eukprot:6675499-Prorocentrum_lima.AAC.1